MIDRKKKKVVVNLMMALASEGQNALQAFAEIIVRRSKNAGELKALTEKIKVEFDLSELESEQPEHAFIEAYSRVLITPYANKAESD